MEEEDESYVKPALAICFMVTILAIAVTGVYLGVRPGPVKKNVTISNVTTVAPEVSCDDDPYLCIEQKIDKCVEGKEPCSNFYKHACGGCEFPFRTGLNGTMWIYLDQVKQTIIDRLKYPQDASGTGPAKLLNFIKSFFRKCSDPTYTVTCESVGHHMTELKDKLTLEELLIEAITRGIPNLFSFEPMRDPDSSSKASILLIKLNPFWLFGDFYGKKDFYGNLRGAIFTQLQKHREALIPEFSKEIYGKALDFLKRAKNIYYKKHEDLMEVRKSDGDPFRWDNYVRLQDRDLPRCRIANQTKVCTGDGENPSGFNFATVFASDKFKEALKSPTHVVIEDHRRWSEMVSEEFSVESFRIILQINYYLEFSPYCRQNHTLIMREQEKVMGIFRRESDRDTWCVEKIVDYSPYALSFLFDANKDKETRIQSMFHNMQQAMKDLVTRDKDNLSMSDAGPVFSRKAENMQLLLRPKWTDKYIAEDMNIANDGGASMQLHKIAGFMARWKAILTFKACELDNDGADYIWTSSPLQPNSYYSYYYNTIELSLSSLSGIYFNLDVTDDYNYPTLGFIMARQMLHAYDRKGRLFDENARFAGPMYSQGQEVFEMRDNNMKASFLKERLKHEGVKRDKVVYHENHDLENFADFSAPLLAFTAYYHFNKEREPKNLIKLRQDFNVGAFFFYVLANTMCENAVRQYGDFLDEAGYHPKSFTRLTTSLMNNPHFAWIFQCNKSAGNQELALNLLNPYFTPPSQPPTEPKNFVVNDARRIKARK